MELFNDLPRTLFWVKDRNCVILQINQAVSDQLNLPSEDIIGKADRDLYPAKLAQEFEKDDRQVMETGQPIRGKIELLINHFGKTEWRKITKLPIFDKEQNVIGTTGISIPFNQTETSHTETKSTLKHIVQHAKNEIGNHITVTELAHFAGVSESTLNRKFRKSLGLSPQELLGQLRLDTACVLLESTTLTISEISYKSGFKSPAAFSRAFRNRKKVSPTEFREG